MQKHISIGADVGGSHISCSAYDLNSKTLIKESFSSISVNNQGSKEEILSRFTSLFQACISKINKEALLGIGIAMPGPFDYINGIGLFTGENAKFQHLNAVNLRTELQGRLNLENIPIRFINDATAFAIGEYFCGKLASTKRSLAITLGTGLGSAFLHNGIPVIIEKTVPKNGCIWHLPFEEGIADDYFSTRGLTKRFFDQTGTKLKGVKELADLAAESATVTHLFQDFGEKLIDLLAPWLVQFKVETIVFGGNISRASDWFTAAMHAQLKKENIDLKIEFSELQESAAFIGGACLLQEEFWKSVQTQLKYM